VSKTSSRSAKSGQPADKKIARKPEKALHGEANSMGVIIVDPVVKPKGTRVRIIREAVSNVIHKQ
jgi:hypothetical protein